MPTRAVIIRKAADGRFEYGQTFEDGHLNTDTLNYGYRTPQAIDELFARRSRQGIKSLRDTVEGTQWFAVGDLYNYGRVDAETVFGMGVGQWMEATLDHAEYVSLWDDDNGQWVDFPVWSEGYETLAIFLHRMAA